MKNKAALLLLLALAACDTGMEAEVISSGEQFPLRANWTSAAAPIGSSTVRANVTIKEFLGSRMEVSTQLTGGAGTTAYQWRIFRGNCAETAVAANNTSPTGLLVFATTASYPDVTTTGGTGSVKPVIAGALDSLTAYSVRFRVAQTATNWNGTSPIACGNLTRS